MKGGEGRNLDRTTRLKVSKEAAKLIEAAARSASFIHALPSDGGASKEVFPPLDEKPAEPLSTPPDLFPNPAEQSSADSPPLRAYPARIITSPSEKGPALEEEKERLSMGVELPIDESVSSPPPSTPPALPRMPIERSAPSLQQSAKGSEQRWSEPYGGVEPRSRDDNGEGSKPSVRIQTPPGSTASVVCEYYP